MPNLNFVLPHWLYWLTLVLFPLAAAALYRRERRRPHAGAVSLPVAYLFLVTAGYAGVHRLYLGSRIAVLVFLPVFAGILYCNDIERNARDGLSQARQDERFAQRQLEAAQADIAAGVADPSAIPAFEAEVAKAAASFGTAQEQHRQIRKVTRGLALLLLLLLVVEALRMPGLVARRRAKEAATHPEDAPRFEAPRQSAVPEWLAALPARGMLPAMIRGVDALCCEVGHFVAMWSVIAVFAYYYEVIARYVFNSPTNWVHESMFLMFGMQYMLAGAFALRSDGHVRVDILYARFSERGKAVADLVTSVFFLIFTGTMLWTGARFAIDAVNVGEVSFTEWGIQYWPVKLSIPIGAALIILEGLVRLARDVIFLTTERAP